MGNVVEIEHKTSLGLIQQTAASAFNLEMGYDTLSTPYAKPMEPDMFQN